VIPAAVRSLPVSAPAESRHRRGFRWRGAIGAVLLAPVLVLALLSPPMIADDSWLHALTEALAWACFVAGAALRFWATLYIGGRKERVLVVDGPYSLCRHPLYLGSLLLGVSAGLFFESPATLLALLVVATVYMRSTVPIEEAVLRARHQDAFDAYAAFVPRWWPRRWKVRTPAEITVDVRKLWLECARASRWAWLPAVGLALRYVRTLGWLPRLLRVP
jgi:protein-S-isoprenylcysteine O-methyltransferase Ste14